MAPVPVPSPVPSPSVSIKSYQHKDWKLTYRYKPASPGFEDESPLLLIHPVGIGLSSWFWERVMDAWTGPAVYAPNLIGCGVQEGSDPWVPSDQERGLTFPLGWVQGCETLMQDAESSLESSASGALPFYLSQKKDAVTFTVVAQGGLAPVGVLLASRNPNTVGKLILTSPPRWKDMTTAVPQAELDRNYNFLRSPIWGKLAFSVLESRKAVEFFSNRFLFREPCDDEWLEKGGNESCVEARPPVMAFNAGFCNPRSFEEELLALEQPTLVLGGEADKRQRQEYTEKMKECILVKNIPGLNVLPWESPELVAEAIRNF
jgi:pimeloyl-ACP methyl ester carboxylesterase